MNRIIYLSIALLIAVGTNSCISGGDPVIEIIDDFDLWTRDGQSWSFMCKLACGSHPKIADAQNVQWNDRTIIVKNKNSNLESEWYIFHSSAEKIKCCQGNQILGPIDSLAMISFMNQNNVIIEKTKVVTTR